MVERAVETAMRRLLEAGGSSARSVVSGGSRPLHHLEEGAGAPVVLLHGGTGGGANWFRLFSPLAQSYRVLAPDLPGFGLSAHGAPGAPLGRSAAELLDGWLSEHGIEGALVVGTSFGGLAALRLAQSSPARVTRLLLLAAAGLGRGVHPMVRLATVPGLTGAAVRPTRRGATLLFRTLLTTDRSDLDIEQRAALLDYLHASARAAGTRYLATTLRLFAGPRGQREVLTSEELRALPQAVSVVWGARDRFLPVAHARRAGSLCPGATTRILPGVGHSPNWEAPDAVLAAIHELAARPLHEQPDPRRR
jgi:pimeloyl-ACP methyl ester carboxylesterase